MSRGRAVVSFAEEVLVPYRYGFIERLRTNLDERGVDLRYLYGRSGPGDDGGPSWVEPLPQWELSLANRRLVWQSLTAVTTVSDLVILDEGARLLSSFFHLLRQGRHHRLALWGHGKVSPDREAPGAAYRVRRWAARRPDWWFAYTEGSAHRVASAGFPRDRITVVDNAIDTTTMRGHYEAVRAAGARREPFRCAFVGTFYRYKRMDYLLRAADHLARRCPGFALDVVGEGEMWPEMARAAADRPWLTLLGRRAGRPLVETLARAQLVLSPAAVGLGVLDSFATETPVVAVRGLGHGPELEYVRPEGNGFVLPEGTTPSSYADLVLDLLTCPGRVEAARQGCRESASLLTLDHMVENFAGGVMAALDASLPRHTPRPLRHRFPGTSGSRVSRGRRGTGVRSARPSA